MITLYLIPTPNADPNSITAGPNGDLWFTETSAIGQITTGGVFSEFPLPSGYAAYWIAPGPDGAMWITEGFQTVIGRVTISGAFSRYDVTDRGTGSTPGPIIAGPGGALWYTTGTSLGEVVFVTANLSVSPSSGFYGAMLTFSGSGFAPGETVDIYAAGFGSPVLASAIADSSGAIAASGPATVAVYGPRYYLASGQSSGNVGAANFSMEASLVLSPSSGPPGTVVTVTGFGFDLGTVDFFWDGSIDPMGSVNVTRYGSFGGSNAFTFAVPANQLPGSVMLTANGPYQSFFGEAYCDVQ
jgi:hypothetical protein